MARNKKANGGANETSGTRDWEQDAMDKPGRYNNAPKVQDAAEARKRGGRAKKNVGGIAGYAKDNAGRAPRKAGGRTGSNMNPFSSAKAGTPAKGRKVG